MKLTFATAVIIVFCMLLLPLISVSGDTDQKKEISTTQNFVSYNKENSPQKLENFKVLKNDTVITLSAREYIFGVVAAEMPALYEEEALKAQAVAAYTFAFYKSGQSNGEYDISASPEEAQCYITREETAQKWGENTDEYTKKIEKCVDEVLGQYLVYDDQIIFAAYHAISSGTTNSCADVWGTELPYLVSVDSVGDRLAKGYLSETVFTADELSQKLESIANPDGQPQNYFSDINKNSSGYVKTLKFCGKDTTGSQICKLLELRSSNFEVSFADGSFTFSCVGYGHGVGMSQNGANYMAQQGSTYEEILYHYYKGAVLKK